MERRTLQTHSGGERFWRIIAICSLASLALNSFAGSPSLPSSNGFVGSAMAETIASEHIPSATPAVQTAFASKVPISMYAAEWNPTRNAGTVTVKVGTNPDWAVPVESTGEFVAVLLILQTPGVAYDKTTKALCILPRTAGS